MDKPGVLGNKICRCFRLIGELAEINLILKTVCLSYDFLHAFSYLTFGGPCIVIYSYNKTNEVDHFTNLFWYRTLHVSDRFTVHHKESSTV